MSAAAVAAALVLPGLWVATAGGGHETHPAGAATPAREVPTAADVCFVSMMIPHHEQAVRMSDLLLAKPGVWDRGRRYAEFVRAAQAREVETMRRWLDAWAADPGTHGPHADAVAGCDHGGPMPGMLTEDQLAALEAAGTTAAQRLYLELMIPHHDGALDMAHDEIAAGSNVYAISVAKHVVTDQLGEIAAMRSMLAELAAAPVTTTAGRARVGVVLALALLVGLLVPGRLVHVFTLDSASMLPTLRPGDRVLVNRLDSPGRGDLVVFRDPGGWVRSGSDGGSYLVKRVIGMPGDRVTCCSRGALVVNGEPLAEPYLADGGRGPASAIAFDVTVPPGALWVMGDNRGDSRDSRSDPLGEHTGAVGLDLVTGVVALAWGDAGPHTF